MQLKMKKNKLIFIGMGILVLALTLAVIVVAVNTVRDRETLEEESSIAELAPKNMRYVNDIYNGYVPIPSYDIPENTYEINRFLEREGKIHYEGAIAGVDVSDHQQVIDWAKVKESGISFAIIRVGYRGFTEGGLVADEQFEANIQGALENGIDVGVYFFSQAMTVKEAQEEADYVLERVEGYPLAYPVVFDWEYITHAAEGVVPRTEDATSAQITAFTKAFCERIEENGYIPAYYTNKNMAYDAFDLQILADYDFWLAEYTKAPSFFYDFQMWQYTDSGVVPGIPVEVDLNLCFKSYP